MNTENIKHFSLELNDGTRAYYEINLLFLEISTKAKLSIIQNLPLKRSWFHSLCQAHSGLKTYVRRYFY